MSEQLPAGLLQRLAASVGPERVITDHDDLFPYSHDELPGHQAYPQAVVRPGTAGEVQAVVRECVAAGVPVTPRGAGTGLCGGAVPSRGGVVLSLDRMNRLLEVDEANLTVTAEPGVILGHLQKAVEDRGLFYPPDPASLDSCSLGGNVAENSGGPRAVKYGVTRDYVIGLEVVLPDGTQVEYGGKYVKNTAGYDLTHWFLGSEGTLGVITKVTLRLLPLPPKRVDLLLPFENCGVAARAVSEIMRSKRILPTLLEFMDQASLKACEAYLGHELPFSGAGAQLIVGLEGSSDAELEAYCETIGEIAFGLGAEDVLVADNAGSKERLWKARRELLETLKATHREVELEDLVVPRAEIPALVDGVGILSAKWGVPVATWGHAGDGNVHVAVLRDGELDQDWLTRREGAVSELFALACRLGGTISGEHGIGSVKRRYLPLCVGEREIQLMRDLKRLLDPQNLMNPGKVLPEA